MAVNKTAGVTKVKVGVIRKEGRRQNEGSPEEGGCREESGPEKGRRARQGGPKESHGSPEGQARAQEGSRQEVCWTQADRAAA